MTDNIKEKLKEAKELNKKIKGLEKQIKDCFKEKECEGYVISKSVKNTILNGVYYIKEDYTYNILRDNLYIILNTIPDHLEKQNEINETIYKKLIDIFYDRITYKNEYDSNMNILNCISNIEEISEWNRRELSCNCDRLLTELRTCNNKKKIVCSKLLKNIANLHNGILESRIVQLLRDIEDENKLESLNSLMDYISDYNASNLGLYIDKFLDYIEYKKDDSYDKNLNKIIKKLYNPICTSKKTLVDLVVLEQILKYNLSLYNNPNMDIVINLLNGNYFKMNFCNTGLLIYGILETNFKDEKFKDMFINIINNVVFLIKDRDLQFRILNRLFEVKTVKSLEVFKDLYPILNKYMKKDVLLNVVSEITKEEIEIPGKVKKLTIPIEYKLEED